MFWGPAGQQVYIYDAAGRFEATVGGEGSGPGEFRSIGNGLFVDGSTVHAFDSRMSRRTTIDIRTGTVLGTAPAPHDNVMNAAFPSASTFVVSGAPGGAHEVGYPLHVFTIEGEALASFGLDEPQQDRRDEYPLVRRLASAGDGTFWSVPPREYRLEHWSVDGDRLRSFTGVREGFTSFESGNISQGQNSSQINSISVDDDGFVWLLYATLSPGWENAIERVPGRELDEGSGPRYRILPGRNVRDYHLEVIDPRAGVVLVRTVLPDSYYRLANRNTLVRTWDDYDTGISHLAAIEVTLQR